MLQEAQTECPFAQSSSYHPIVFVLRAWNLPLPHWVHSLSPARLLLTRAGIPIIFRDFKNMNVTGASILGTVTMGWLDMGVFVMMLSVSAVIGCYFGFCSGRKNSASEYLMGGKNMGILPISLSLISRQVFCCINSIFPWKYMIWKALIVMSAVRQ